MIPGPGAPATAPKLPTPAPAAVAPSPAQPAQPAQQQPAPAAVAEPLPRPPEGEFPFRLDELKISDKTLGGANPKFVVEGPDGSLWMFKDYGYQGAAYRGNVDALASRVARAAGVPHPETYMFDLPKGWGGWDSPNLPSYLRGRSPRSTRGAMSRLYADDAVASFDIGGGVGGMNVERLGAEAILDVQTEHALNWLVSNGDGHFENFIRLNNGRVAGIDKSQGFKFFGRDRLAIDYVSPQAPLPSTNGFAYAESQLVRYSRGQMGNTRLTPVFDEAGELTDFGIRLRNVQQIPDLEYANTIRPYVEAMHEQGRGMFGSGSRLRGASVDDALDAIVARKNSVIDDFDKLYRDLEAQRRKALGIVEQPVVVATPEAEELARRSLFSNGDEVLATVAEEKMTGYTIFTGGSSFEDMALHGFRYKRKGETGANAFQFQFRSRLRPAASRNLTSRLEDLNMGRTPSSSGIAGTKTNAELLRESKSRINAMWEGGSAAGEDPDGIFRFIKSFNARMDPSGQMYDGGKYVLSGQIDRYNEVYTRILKSLDDVADLTTAAKRRQAVARLGYEPTAAEVRVAKQYREMMREFKRPDGSWNTNNVESIVGRKNQLDMPNVRVSPKPKNKLPDSPEDRIVIEVERKQAGQMDELSQIGTKGADEAIQLESTWGSDDFKRWMMDGDERETAFDLLSNTRYDIRTPGNPSVRIQFSPHDARARQAQGEFKIIFDKSSPTAKDLRDARRMIEELGIPVAENGATVEEMKVLWARKQARSIGLDIDPSTKSLFRIADDLPYDQQLAKLEEAFDASARMMGTNRYKWSSLTDDMGDADFLPQFHDTTRRVGGQPQWLRRDITEEAFENDGIFGAYSSITGGRNDIIKSLLESGVDGMNATWLRSRMGTNWWSGMSPTSDMRTGGANYVFTRINPKLRTPEIRKMIKSGEFDPRTQSLGNLSFERIGTIPEEGVYYNTRSLRYSDNVWYRNDKFGEVTDGFIENNAIRTTQSNTGTGASETYRNAMTASNNEVIMKRSVGFEDVDFWVVDNLSVRADIIEKCRAAGRTEFGGKPIEEFFIARRSM